MGMSLVYGLTGGITFEDIRLGSAGLGDEPAFILGVIFVLVGFGFKISAVPFHFWAPDTYQGAPTPVAAYLSVGSKAAGFVGLLTITYLAFSEVRDIWGPVLWLLAALTMTVGNLIALRQTNIVRLLGYSSIAHAGFILVPFAMAANLDSTGLEDAFFGSVTYLIVYAFMNLGAFAVVVAGASKVRSGELADWAGMFRYAPGLATLLALFFFSLAGIPPLAGWFAKFVMFRAVLGAGGSWASVLAVIAAVNAVIALVYYARVVKTAFMDPVPAAVSADEAAERQVARPLALALGLTALAVVVAGFFPQVLAFSATPPGLWHSAVSAASLSGAAGPVGSGSASCHDGALACPHGLRKGVVNRSVVVIVFALVAEACGGGGGSSSTAAPTTTPTSCCWTSARWGT